MMTSLAVGLGPLASWFYQDIGLVLFGNFAAGLTAGLGSCFRGAVAGLSPELVIVMALIGFSMAAKVKRCSLQSRLLSCSVPSTPACAVSSPAMKPRCLSVQQQAAARSPIRAEWKAQRSKPLTHGLALPLSLRRLPEPLEPKTPCLQPPELHSPPSPPRWPRRPAVAAPPPPGFVGSASSGYRWWWLQAMSEKRSQLYPGTPPASARCGYHQIRLSLTPCRRFHPRFSPSRLWLAPWPHGLP